MIKILELFGGIGSPRKALINLGIDVKSIDYVEIDEKAVRSYNAMFDNSQRVQDVQGWNLKPDILVHGSPCQDISIAGKRLGADQGSNTRSSLMWETINIIKNFGVWKPKVVIWENVKGVLHKHMIGNFNKYLHEMEMLGYKNSFECLNALDYGLPQSRERVFTISMLGEHFDFSKLKKRPLRDIKEYLTDDYGSQHIVRQPSMLKRIGTQPCKGFKGYIPVIDKYCYTITTKQMRCPNSGVIKLDNGYRYLTEKECWLLQGFSEDDYNNALKVNKCVEGKMNGALYKQAGNSMPVTILEEIFRVILGVDNGTSIN